MEYIDTILLYVQILIRLKISTDTTPQNMIVYLTITKKPGWVHCKLCLRRYHLLKPM